jgi:hypothetical protein
LGAIMRQAHRSSRHAEQGARISNALRIFWALKGALRGDLYITVGHLARLLGDFPRAQQAAARAIVAHRSAAAPDTERLAW